MFKMKLYARAKNGQTVLAPTKRYYQFLYTRMSQNPRADIWGQIILGCAGLSMHCRMLSCPLAPTHGKPVAPLCQMCQPKCL